MFFSFINKFHLFSLRFINGYDGEKKIMPSETLSEGIIFIIDLSCSQVPFL